MTELYFVDIGINNVDVFVTAEGLESFLMINWSMFEALKPISLDDEYQSLELALTMHVSEDRTMTSCHPGDTLSKSRDLSNGHVT